MNTKRGFGSAGLILVVLIILGGGMYLWSQKKVETPAPTNVPADNSFKTLPSPINDTVDWKTYRNDEYGFEFKYPQSFKPIEGDSGIVGLQSDGVSFFIDKDEADLRWQDMWEEYRPAEEVVIDGNGSRLVYLIYGGMGTRVKYFYFLQIARVSEENNTYRLSLSFTSDTTASLVSGEFAKRIFSTFRVIK